MNATERSSTNAKPFFFSLLLFLCFLQPTNASAQIYPVQVIPQLIAPYTASVSEYYSGSAEKLVISLINTDLTKPTLQVRLKMNIKSPGVNLVSRDDVYFPSITLDAGVMQRISLNDLAPYFDANNLIFQGITRAQYQQTRKLPEGFYQFCFEVYEYNTNRLVGRNNCAMAWISLLDPPLLNLPRKSESIAYKDPTNIIFQWTPRNMGNPTAAFNTEYEFTLVELWDNGIAPEAAFNSSQPLYRTTTQATTLLYGPTEPLLIPGKRYGWRIRAQFSDGSQNSDTYKNNGYSEIYWFTFQRDCPTPFNVQSDVNGGRATITWTAGLQQNRYTVDYREKNQSSSTWYTINSSTNRVMLYDLKKGKQYEYRVGGYCDLANGSFPTDGAVYSDIKSFSLDGSTKDENLACGILQPELKITNRTPIQNLLSGEIISAGDFPVKLVNVQGNGTFNGNGYITIPFLGKAAVKVRFSGITVNTDKQLIGGLIEASYDNIEQQIVAIDTIIKDLQNTVIACKAAIDNLVNSISEKVENKAIADNYMKQMDEYFNDPSNTQITTEQKQFYKEHRDEIKDAVQQGITAVKEKIAKDGIDKEEAKKYLTANLVDNTRQNIAAKKEEIDRINSAIDYEKLVKWLRDNKGKTVAYSYKDFLNDENVSLGLGNGSTIPVSKAYTYTINGEAKTLQLKGSLSTEDGTVTLTAANTLLPVSIDFANDKINYYEDHYFDGRPKSDPNSVAVHLTTNTFNDLDYLLQLQEYKHGEEAKQYYQKVFDNGFIKAGNDCDKIDVLYQEIPPFVTRSDDDKWKDLVSLSKCRIDETGTNEYKAIINLLKSFTPAYLYDKVLSEKDFFINLTSQFKDKYIADYAIAFMPVGSEKWTEAQTGKGVNAYLYEKNITHTELDPTTGLDIEKVFLIGSSGRNKADYTYRFGNDIKAVRKGSILNEQVQATEEKSCGFSDPVLLYANDQYSFYAPAFIAYEITDRIRDASHRADINVALTAVLPEAPHLAWKVNRLVELILNTGKETGIWIDELAKVLPAEATTKITTWIEDGLNANKLEKAFNSTLEKSQLFNSLNSSKGINHQRAIIGDYLSIPGVSEGKFISNAVDNITTNVLEKINNNQFILKQYQSETFAKDAALEFRSSIEVIDDLGNGIQFVKIKPGTKLYRVFDGYLPGVNTSPKGNYWTFEKPSNIADVIGGTAVMPEWNAMSKIIEIEVPANGVYVWRGIAAKQPASSSINAFYLKGGIEQVIFDLNQNRVNITTITKSITSFP